MREKETMLHEVVESVPEKERGRNIVADETIKLTGVNTIWAALLTHLIVRYIKFKSRAACSYSRFVAFIRAVVWLKKDLMEILRSYGIAPPLENAFTPANMPCLPGFEKILRQSMG